MTHLPWNAASKPGYAAGMLVALCALCCGCRRLAPELARSSSTRSRLFLTMAGSTNRLEYSSATERSRIKLGYNCNEFLAPTNILPSLTFLLKSHSTSRCLIACRSGRAFLGASLCLSDLISLPLSFRESAYWTRGVLLLLA